MILSLVPNDTIYCANVADERSLVLCYRRGKAKCLKFILNQKPLFLFNDDSEVNFNISILRRSPLMVYTL